MRTQEAASAFEAGFELQPDHQCAYNLAVCPHASGDPEAMRAAFWRLAQVQRYRALLLFPWDVGVCAVALASMLHAGSARARRCSRQRSC